MPDAPARGPARRELLATAAALAVAPAAAAAAPTARVRPGQPGWPSAAQWSAIGAQPVAAPELAPADAVKLLKNPYYLRDQAALTQASGYVDAWRSQPSAYVVRARSAAEVAAAVRFAAAHRLRLVVKGGGHSYLGGSSAPDSLLVWTRDLTDVALHDGFVPQGSTAAPTPAVSLGAGCIWREAYDAVTSKGGRYVQGGGCTTVGVAGLVQGGGFGSFSKTFGLAAASLLEAEVVTADGQVRVVNAAQDPDLFWALKGGGGGSFGVVTRLTLKTHELPKTFGVVSWEVKAADDAAFHALVARFLDLYAERLFNPHWGEQVRLTPSRRFAVNMLFQGLGDAEARAAWAPLTEWVAAQGEAYTVTTPFLAAALPARLMWNGGFVRQAMAGAVTFDSRPEARPADFWWTGDGEQAGAFWHGYESVWMPASLLRPQARAQLADAWIAASRHWSIAFHFNKGLAGAPADALAASRDTAMNPQVLDAFALAITAMDGASAYPGFAPPDLAEARTHQASIRSCAGALRAVAPGAGSYLSESDHGLEDWRGACWGEHYARLARVKRRYDPQDLFVVHHGVGSERWSGDGFSRI